MNETRIVGSGLAGLLVAQHLLEIDHAGVIMHDHDDDLSASNAPLAICHPFPGRSLKPSPHLEAAYMESSKWMARWASWAPELVSELDMERPFESLGGERLRASYDKYWADGANRWFSIQMNEDETGLRYGPCYAVRLGQLRKIWKERLQADGVSFDKAPVPRGWKGPLVLCPGRGLKEWFPKLPLTREGGELVTYSSEHHLTNLMSGGGVHIGPFGAGAVVGGSTRWTGEPPKLESQVDGLTQQLRALWPHTGTVSGVWRGMRAIHQTDRLPLAGPIPSRPKTWVVAALGSKGLLWGPLAARVATDHLSQGTPLPEAISTARIAPGRWELAWPDETA